MPPPPPKIPAVLVLGADKLVPVVAVVLVEPKVPAHPPNLEVPPPKAPKPIAGLGAPKIEAVVAVVAFCPKLPIIQRYQLAQQTRREKRKTLSIPKRVVVALVVPRLPNIGFAGCCCWV